MSAVGIYGPQLLDDASDADGAQRRAAAASSHNPWPDSVNELCEEFADVCRSAVDSLEIASALEFEGLSDQAAQRRYGYSDVFALAQDMYYRVPRQPAEPELPPDPWQGSKFRPALHSVLYGIPAVCFPAAVGLMVGPGVLVVLIVALLVAWSLAQGLAYLGYLRLGQSGKPQAQRILRAGLVAGLDVVLVAMAVTGRITHAPLGVMAFGAGEGIYMLGACVLMVLGYERWMLAALAPGVLGSTVFLLLGKPPRQEHLAWGVLAATPLLALVLAVACTRAQGPADGPVIRAADLLGMLPATGFGLVAAGLLAFPVAAGMDGHGGVNPGALLATLPLSLSMGVAEWNLLWFRRRTQRLLRTNTDLRVFAMQARLALVFAVLQYVLAAAALTVAAVVVAGTTGLLPLSWTYLPQVLAYLALGSAMFLALSVQALGLRSFPLVACAITLAFEIVLRRLGVITQIVACGELLIALAGYAVITLGKAVRHIY